MAQTNQTPSQTGQSQVQSQDTQQPVEEQTAQQPAEEQVEQQSVQEDKPKLITYLGNNYELDNYIKQLQYNIGPYISYLKLDKNQSRTLRDCFNLFIGKLKSGEVSIDNAGAWIDYAGEMSNTEKGFDPWGLVVRLANMGLSSISPYKEPTASESETTELPEFMFNSNRGYLFDGQDTLVTQRFPNLSWEQQRNILKQFFNYDAANPQTSYIYNQWSKFYSSPFEGEIINTIKNINEELNQENTTGPSEMLKFYLSRLGYNPEDLWPTKKTTQGTSDGSATSTAINNNPSSAAGSYSSDGSSSTSGNSTGNSSTTSNFDSFVNSLTNGINYDDVLLTFKPGNYRGINDSDIQVNNLVRGNKDRQKRMLADLTTILYNINTTTINQLGWFLKQYFSGHYNYKQFNEGNDRKAAMLYSILLALRKEGLNIFTSPNTAITEELYFNTFNHSKSNYYLIGIKYNQLKRFKWNTTEWGRKRMQELFNNSTSSKKKGGTIVKARLGLPSFLERVQQRVFDPEGIFSDSQLLSQQTPVVDSTQDQTSEASSNSGPTTIVTSPSIDQNYLDSIQYNGDINKINKIATMWDSTTNPDGSKWMSQQITNGNVIFTTKNEDGSYSYYSIPESTARQYREELPNYWSGTKTVANEDTIPTDSNAKWIASLLNSANQVGKGIFTALNNDTNSELLRNATVPELKTPQTYTYSPITTNFSTQQLQRQKALTAERQQQLAADQQSDITLGLNARKSATLDRLNNEQAISTAADSQLRTDMSTAVTDQNKQFNTLSDIFNTNRANIQDARFKRAQIEAANRTKNTEDVWGGLFDAIGANIQNMFTDRIERDDALIKNYWRERSNRFMDEVFNRWKAKTNSTDYSKFMTSEEYLRANEEVQRMLTLREDYTPSASTYNFVLGNFKRGGKLTQSILNKLRR